MVNLVTGPIRSGKTAKLTAIADDHPRAGGFCCPKNWQERRHTGYLIRCIATGASVPFAVLQTEKPVGWREADQIGPWSISTQGFQFAHDTIRQSWDQNHHPIFLDEIGPLELMDRGFANLFRKLLAGPTELYTVVRESLVEQVIHHFDLKQYTRIEVE